MTTQQGQIVVGYDGSSQSGLAVDWAAALAQRRGVPLLVLAAAEDQGLIAATRSWISRPTQAARPELADEGAARARRVAPLAHIGTRADHSGATSALIEASRGAALTVVGNRGHGEIFGATIGSVAFEVSTYAHSSVVVVRGAADLPGPHRFVVVGVDNSEDSDAAVCFAADIAAETQAPLMIVGAYRSAVSQVSTGAALLTLASASEPGTVVQASGRETSQLEADGGPTFEAIVRETGERAVVAASMIASGRHAGLTIIERVVQGAPAEVLRDAATGGLLVVGSRGRGNLAALTLGSVSHSVIHTADCPVAVIRHRA